MSADTAPRPGSTRHTLSIVRSVIIAHLQVLTQYRVNTAVWMGASLLQVLVYMAVWRSVAEASGGALSGYTAAQFAGYFLVLLFVREMTYTWVAWHFPTSVQNGKLSPQLLLPAHPLLDTFGRIGAVKIQGIMMLTPAAILLWLLFDAQINAGLTQFVVMIALMPIAIIVRFLADSILALTSFWLVRIDGIRGLYYLGVLMLSGQFAPIAVFPDSLQTVMKALPWWWTMGYPVELMTGRQDLASAPVGVGVLVAWGVGLHLILRFVWRKGVEQYGAVGA